MYNSSYHAMLTLSLFSPLDFLELDFMIKQAAEFEAEQKKSGDMKVEAEEVQRDMAEPTSSKEDKMKEAEASGEVLQSALAAFGEASKVVAESNAEKLENDKAMVEVLDPANARKADAIKEKEILAGEVVTLQKSIEEAQNSNKNDANNSDAKVLTKSNELKEQKAKFDKAREDFEEIQKNDAAAEATLASEINEHKEFATKFEAATKAEIDRSEQQKRDRIASRVSSLEARRSSLALLEDEHRSDVDNLKDMRVCLLDTKDLGSKIEEAPLLLENGEENVLTLEDEVDDDAASVANHTGSPAVTRG